MSQLQVRCHSLKSRAIQLWDKKSCLLILSKCQDCAIGQLLILKKKELNQNEDEYLPSLKLSNWRKLVSRKDTLKGLLTTQWRVYQNPYMWCQWSSRFSFMFSNITTIDSLDRTLNLQWNLQKKIGKSSTILSPEFLLNDGWLQLASLRHSTTVY